MALQRKAPNLIVTMGGRVVPTAFPLTVEASTGGRLVDNAVIEFVDMPRDEGFATGAVVDFEQVPCKIQKVNPNGSQETIHVGFIDARTIDMTSTEIQHVVSRIQPYHFGYPIAGQYIWNPLEEKASESGEPIVFNPELDGRVVGNMSTKTDPTSKAPLFIHPEAARNELSLTRNGAEEAKKWTLVKAVQYLCLTGNPDQKSFKNPTLAELGVLSDDEETLRNHRQPFGAYLPQQLDALLEPYGYFWWIDHSAGKLIFQARGKGTPIETKLQAPGAVVDMNASTTEEMNVTADVASRLVNDITMMGDWLQIESTFELVPAWKPAHDSIPYSPGGTASLQRDGGEGKVWESQPELARVYRDFVLNECGDYGEGRASNFSEPFDFNEHFDEDYAETGPYQVMYRRRKFLPCITLGDDGNPIGGNHGIDVEYFRYNHDPVTPLEFDFEAGEWVSFSHTHGDAAHIKVLEKECGIRFDGPEIPSILAAYGATNIRIRVTASVEMDIRLFVNEVATSSINQNKVEQILDVPSRFKWRKISSKSKFWSNFDLKDTAVDDKEAAEKLAKELLENWNQASVNGTVVIPGTDWLIGNPLGKPFKGIAGRNIDFKTTSGTAKYPQVTGYKFDFQEQKITLNLDTWRRDV